MNIPLQILGDVIYVIIIFFITLIIGIYYFRKKRDYKNFKLVVSVSLTLSLLSFIWVSICVVDVVYFLNGNYETSVGKCEVVRFEEEGRFAPDNYVQVSIGNQNLTGSLNNFSEVQEGIYSCEVKYTKLTGNLIEFTKK